MEIGQISAEHVHIFQFVEIRRILISSKFVNNQFEYRLIIILFLDQFETIPWIELFASSVWWSAFFQKSLKLIQSINFKVRLCVATRKNNHSIDNWLEPFFRVTNSFIWFLV